MIIKDELMEARVNSRLAIEVSGATISSDTELAAQHLPSPDGQNHRAVADSKNGFRAERI